LFAMPSLLKAAVLGVLQGLTEFLPVSSTAHLLIASRLIGFDDPGGVFTIMIQLGSILAIMWLYRQKIVHVVATLGSDPDSRNFALSVIVATIPALVAGALLSSFVKRVPYASFGVIGAPFFVGGVLAENHLRRVLIGRDLLHFCRLLWSIAGIVKKIITKPVSRIVPRPRG